MSNPTTVISVRGRPRAELEADPGFVYVGRPCYGWPGSDFGNPFKGADAQCNPIGPEEAVRRFVAWLETGEDFGHHTPKAMARRRETILRRLPDLRGRVLGCWCLDWAPALGEPRKPCHAVALARLADMSHEEPRA